jgi:hypothetical protein
MSAVAKADFCCGNSLVRPAAAATAAAKDGGCCCCLQSLWRGIAVEARHRLLAVELTQRPSQPDGRAAQNSGQAGLSSWPAEALLQLQEMPVPAYPPSPL